MKQVMFIVQERVYTLIRMQIVNIYSMFNLNKSSVNIPSLTSYLCNASCILGKSGRSVNSTALATLSDIVPL